MKQLPLTPPLHRLTKWLLPAVLISLGVVFGLSTRNIRIDDSFIFYSYIRNILAGNGWVFNSGEYVNGLTSALYPIVVAALSFFTSLTPDIVGHWTGIAGLVCLLILLKDKSVGQLGTGIIFPLVLLNSRSLSDAVGMETFLTLALLAATLALYLKDKLTAATLVFSLAVLSRPDSALFGIVLLVDYLAKHRTLPQLRHIIPLLLVLGTWLTFSLAYFGEPLPNTIGAKLAQSGHEYWGGEYAFLLGARRLLNGFGMLGYLFPLGLLLILLRPFELLKQRWLFLILCWGIAYFISYALILKTPPYRWYYVPLILPIAATITWPLIKAPKAMQWVVTACLLFSYGKLVQRSLATPVTAKYDIYKRTASWLNANTPKESSIGAMEIGILGYYYENGKIIDGLGLINSTSQNVAARSHDQFIHEFKPDFLVTNNPPRRILEDYVREEWFKTQYSLATLVRSPRNPRGVRVYRKNVSPSKLTE